MRPTQRRILETLLRSPRPAGLSLTELAQASGLKPPSVFMQLKDMRIQGLIERVDVARPVGPLYRALPSFSAVWADPAEGVLLEWNSPAGIVWRFPLVSRIPDQDAQVALYALLRLADAHNVLRLPKSSAALSSTRSRSTGGPEPGFSMIVYGSTARGEARPGSDIDVLLLHVGATPSKSPWRDLAAQVNLSESRKVDVREVSLQDFKALPAGLREAVERDGITVFTTLPSGGFIESRRLAGGKA